MANRQEIQETYDFMDKIFRLSFGENADLTCAMYDGDFSKTLAQAQKDKHCYILDGLRFAPGFRVLDIGCGFGPVLKAVKEGGGHGIGLTLSAKQADVCQRSGLDVRVMDWKDLTPDSFGTFDGVVCVGAFEHFCSEQEYLAGRQTSIYDAFFRLCHDVLPRGGRLYLQTMMQGRNAPTHDAFSFDAKKGSNEYIAAVAREFFPGSWLPSGEPQILQAAEPHFELVSRNNGRLDYLQTIAAWSKLWNFTFSNLAPGRFSFARLFAMAELVPRFLTDASFRRRTEFLRKGYDRDLFAREIIDHQRLVFQRK